MCAGPLYLNCQRQARQCCQSQPDGEIVATTGGLVTTRALF